MTLVFLLLLLLAPASSTTLRGADRTRLDTDSQSITDRESRNRRNPQTVLDSGVTGRVSDRDRVTRHRRRPHTVFHQVDGRDRNRTTNGLFTSADRDRNDEHYFFDFEGDRVSRRPRPTLPPSPSPGINLTASQAHGNFQTLQCNVMANLSSISCNSTWSSMFGTAQSYRTEVVIPCGSCIVMDHDPPVLTLAGGLDIQGKLLFPDGYRVTLEAPYVRVQGELHMYSTKIPNGQEDVKFVITGTDETIPMFIPADSNAAVCGGLMCGVGKKPIVVAGGKLVIEALQPDTPTWVYLYDVVGSVADEPELSTGLVLDDSIKDKWGPGAEVLITSHTLNFDDGQVRTITAIYDHVEPGYVIVQLDSGFRSPTTMKNDPNYAVEVALLSRNIIFEGATDDPNNLHGAQLIVYQTPIVVQKLEGVEFRNFGQQGTLGKYPIHFHLCEDVTGSMVSKNLVRESNQRCIVVHGTHNLLVVGNIAYNTSGHCFITEDGFEHGNVFRGNLGALTRKVTNVIPDNGTNGNETDDKPSTFWMTNPSNTWEGNVAAGSEDSGFWFELHKTVRGPKAYLYPDLIPKYEPLTLFTNNVAHSNLDRGMRTYPSGYAPLEQALLLNSRAYRNQGEGMFIHNSRNLAVVGGLFADNRKQIDFDRAEELTLRDATVVGLSQAFRELRQSQSVPDVCRDGHPLVGIQMHTFTLNMDNNGATFDNITMYGFVDTGCSGAVAFNFDDEVESGSFDYFSSLTNIQLEDGATPMDLCIAEKAGVADIYVTDLDSGLRPQNSSFTGTSTIVSDKPWMTTFLSAAQCTSMPNHCYAYCENTCLRTVTYGVDVSNLDKYNLRVCNATDLSQCIELNETYYFDEKDTALETTLYNTESKRRRIFSASLPQGRYEATFLDNNGTESWPTFADEIYEDPFCTDALKEGSIELRIPSLQPGECNSLIRNGDAEESTEHTYWLHRQGGITVAPGAGIAGSNAFVDIVREEGDKDAITQFFDTRCMNQMIGRQYEIKVWVKLADEKTGAAYLCNVNEEDCPEAGVYSYIATETTGKKTAATTSTDFSYNMSDYQLVSGVLDITDKLANASSVMFYVQRNKNNLAMYVDNVSVLLITDSLTS